MTGSITRHRKPAFLLNWIVVPARRTENERRTESRHEEPHSSLQRRQRTCAWKPDTMKAYTICGEREPVRLLLRGGFGRHLTCTFGSITRCSLLFENTLQHFVAIGKIRYPPASETLGILASLTLMFVCMFVHLYSFLTPGSNSFSFFLGT